MQTEKGFSCSITLLQSFVLTEEEVKILLDKEDYETIEEKDWDIAAEKYIQNHITENDIPNVNDIEIEEVWHN